MPKTISIREVAIVIRRRNKVLLVHRPSAGRWGGLWEFPHAALKAGELIKAAASLQAQNLTGLLVAPQRELATLRHSITHHQITLTCVEALYIQGKFQSSCYDCGKWVTPQQIANYPVSSPQRRLAQRLLPENVCG
jgi:A/G-specific adenine glycosylase